MQRMRDLSWRLFEQTGSVASYLLYRRFEAGAASPPPTIRAMLEEFGTLELPVDDDPAGEGGFRPGVAAAASGVEGGRRTGGRPAPESVNAGRHGKVDGATD
ncbi:YqzL family protein [Hydrogenibacillus schlegelii]|uniref:YqzL family protein n=1 Tax=Hydrogenibacillus schlegelii TaxID=1484 RepID=A0A179IRW3_HYDSH|nr:YqzL family protein [Hydrogenibacillus schlegelii]MBT9282980.1 YqzL family protein [Hydrogenibacillus schlegelii]OAR05436.1 hypothetical protein SA87_11095 [Hydrogenibacillus schlegelii]PTQ54353.1 MAG: hypothetical protein HSCHL_0272 [Hydrogenibacillus schlegelii]